MKEAKNILQKFWHLLWKDESWKGWVFSVVVLFIFIKFILFPTLSLVTGTALPLAIVESCSMYHAGSALDFQNWWQPHDAKYTALEIAESQFEKFPIPEGFNKGDILLIIKANPDKLKIGDIIIFNANYQNPLIHRIIKISEKDGKKIFSTMGDNNNGQLGVEKEISEEQLVGKAVLRLVPFLGWGKLIFFEPLRPESEKGLCYQN